MDIIFSRHYAFNLFSQYSDFTDNEYIKEEMKLIKETCDELRNNNNIKFKAMCIIIRIPLSGVPEVITTSALDCAFLSLGFRSPSCFCSFTPKNMLSDFFASISSLRRKTL
jgi:hypothetical protein